MSNLPPTLFHFGKWMHLEPALKGGVLAFSLARKYLDPKLAAAQRDDEQNRRFTPSATAIYVSRSDAPSTPHPIHNLKSFSVTLPVGFDYYSKSFALSFDSTFYRKFDNADCCIEIGDVPTFLKRIEVAIADRWYGCHAEVTYHDFSKFLIVKQKIELAFLKDSRDYAYQAEYRIVLIPSSGSATDELIFVQMQPITDICRVHRPSP